MNFSENAQNYANHYGPALTKSEYFVLAVYLFASTVLFIWLLYQKRDLFSQFFSHFVYIMPFTVICHVCLLFFFLLPELIFLGDDKMKHAIRFYIIMFFSVISVGILPTVPFAVTMVYSILLNINFEPKIYIFHCKITQNRIMFSVVLVCVASYFHGYLDERFLVSISPVPNFIFRIDALKLFFIVITTVSLFKKLYSLLTADRYEKVPPREYAQIVHVSLFLFVFWSIFLTQVVIAIQALSAGIPFEDGSHFGPRDIIVMQYIFAYSMLFSSCKTIKRIFDRSKVLPIEQ